MRPPRAHFVRADAKGLPYPDKFFHCVVTSIPYFRQRKYGDDGREVGREKTPDQFVAGIVAAFEDVRRVLRDDGVLFLNVGDTYNSSGGHTKQGANSSRKGRANVDLQNDEKGNRIDGMKPKELIGIPWLLAFALRRAGWLLRQENIWAKSISFGDRHAENVRRAVIARARKLRLSRATAEAIAEAVEPQIGACMPQSATDRCTTSHETVFMFAKRPKYFADMEAVKERGKDWGPRDRSNWKYNGDGYAAGQAKQSGCEDNDFAEKGRNLRTVWTINTQPVHGMKHYAAYPVRLVEPCVRIGTSEGGCCPACGSPLERVVEKTKTTRERPNDYTKRTGEAGTGNACANTVDGVASRTLGFRPTCECDAGEAVPCRVLDPFGGIGTTAVAALGIGRDCHVVDLYSNYLAEGRKRLLTAIEKSGKPNGNKRRRPSAAIADKRQLEMFA